ncbi:hypothetical protein M8009_14705 [Halomonas sp. ATCH28]|uniref:Transposase n=1 Tax=Halomonas gemina TaxID=2945105 RepID=A0ABT0T3Z1_9GAMM|nr:hypothetical protein [Halomonas gemina]MCL7941537.1 hypothetical protein [Halomonas gemina]
MTLLPVRHVADLVGLHWHTLKANDKQQRPSARPAGAGPDMAYFFLKIRAAFPGKVW